MLELLLASSRIRTMVDEDLEQVLAWRNHQDVRRYMYTQHEISLEEHKRWFERCSQDPNKHVLIFETNSQPLGFVNFNVTTVGSISDWGFYVSPYAAKGTGRNLGRSALHHAFTKLQIHKICGQALAYNERSVRFHQSMGFSKEGILRDQHFDGVRHHDIICFGLLSREWQSNS